MNAEIVDKLIAFRRIRDWEKYHTPQQLAEAVTIEAAELMKCFIWGKKFDTCEIADEIADIVIFLTYLCHDLNIDMEFAVKAKIMQNGQKYPLEERHEW